MADNTTIPQDVASLRKAANSRFHRFRGSQSRKKLGLATVGAAAIGLGVTSSATNPTGGSTTPTPAAVVGADQSISNGDAAEYDSFNNCVMIGQVNHTTQQDWQHREDTNKLKNRYTVPAAAPNVNPERMLQAKAVAQSDLTETNGATVTGYVGDVILEKGESCNCGHMGEEEADDHIYVLPTLTDYQNFVKNRKDKSRVVVVEVTPRIKALAKENGLDWTTPHLQTLIGKQVTFSGWLLMDWEHQSVSAADGANPAQRGTVWEIHPVTRIVFPGG